MNEKLILEKEFLFEAHNEKAFQKLRDNQFVRLTQGLIQEPFANALDQQPPGKPVRVTLRDGRNYALLCFADDGEGLTRTNLESLHCIGKSSKRGQRDVKIGRFGMGLIGAFNRKLEVRRVFITTNVCGRPARITIRCRADGIPSWRLHWLDHSVAGFTIAFLLPMSLHGLLRKELLEFFRDCIVEASFNGQTMSRRPEDLIVQEGDIVGEFGDDTLRALVATPVDVQSSFGKRDDLRIYLRRMLVEKTDSAYHAFRTSGDKMPQNFYNTPYLDHESIVVLSQFGEPTVGRDKLLRDATFERITTAIHQARVDVLLELLPLADDPQAGEKAQKNALNHVLANLSTLYSLVATRLQGKPLADEHEYLAPLLDALAETPAFETCGRTRLLSVREIIDANPPCGVVFYASEPEVFQEFERDLNTPFVLREQRIVMEPIWGYHERYPVSQILKSIINAQPGFEMVSLDQLVWDEEKQGELIRKGILSRRAVRIRRAQSMSREQEEFLDRIRKMLNRPWFRNALGRFDPPSRIRLHAIIQESEGGLGGGEVVAGVIGHDPRHRELDIGINFESRAVGTLIEEKKAEPAFLPILCHELAHRKRSLDDGEEGIIGHTRGFYYDRVRLEDAVLQACVRHLCGEDAEDAEECGQEVVVL